MAMAEENETGPVHVFEGTADDDDVLVLHDSDTQIVSIDAGGNLSTGYIVPSAPAQAPGWDGGW